jgi:hypothetical protein
MPEELTPKKINLPAKLSKRRERLLKIRERLTGVPAVAPVDQPLLISPWSGHIGELRRKLQAAEVKAQQVANAISVIDQQIAANVPDSTRFAPFDGEDDEDDVDATPPPA